MATVPPVLPPTVRLMSEAGNDTRDVSILQDGHRVVQMKWLADSALGMSVTGTPATVDVWHRAWLVQHSDRYVTLISRRMSSFLEILSDIHTQTGLLPLPTLAESPTPTWLKHFKRRSTKIRHRIRFDIEVMADGRMVGSQHGKRMVKAPVSEVTGQDPTTARRMVLMCNAEGYARRIMLRETLIPHDLFSVSSSLLESAFRGATV